MGELLFSRKISNSPLGWRKIFCATRSEFLLFLIEGGVVVVMEIWYYCMVISYSCCHRGLSYQKTAPHICYLSVTKNDSSCHNDWGLTNPLAPYFLLFDKDKFYFCLFLISHFCHIQQGSYIDEGFSHEFQLWSCWFLSGTDELFWISSMQRLVVYRSRLVDPPCLDIPFRIALQSCMNSKHE